MIKFLLFPITFIQICLIASWTIICGLGGIILRVFVGTKKTNQFFGHYVYSPFVLAVCGVRVKVKGKENIPNYPAIYVSNHASQLDIPILFLAVNRPLFYVAKMELKKVPFLGHYMRVMGMIFVDRKNRERAMENLRTAVQDIASGKSIAAFPEGTRSKTDEMLQFKRGAFVIAHEGRIPVVPVVIKGSRKALPSGSYFIKPATVEVEILSIENSEMFFMMSPEGMANYTRERIAAHKH
jgi:1-acyl-sn-glycerol-3-phosphate acyltransferase